MDLGFKADLDQVDLLGPEDHRDLLADLALLELQALEDPLGFLVHQALPDFQASKAICCCHGKRGVLLLGHTQRTTNCSYFFQSLLQRTPPPPHSLISPLVTLVYLLVSEPPNKYPNISSLIETYQ